MPKIGDKEMTMATKKLIASESVGVTSPQKEQVVGGVVSAAREGATQALEDLANVGSLGDLASFQNQVIERQGELNAHIRESIKDLVKRKIAVMVQNIIGILKLISAGEEIIVPATNGTETLAEARDIFTWGIDGAFRNWGTNVPGQPTKATKAQVLEMVEDGDFKTIFNLSGRDLYSLVWEQSQIVAFCRKHKHWLRKDGYATFFLFKVGEGENQKFFVAYVGVYSHGRLRVFCNQFEFGDVWGSVCRRRVVLPQLKLES